jgi:hypothetical protein
MSSIARIVTSHHGLQHPYKDAWAVADSLTGIHSAMVRYIFVVNRSCIYESLQVKIQRVQIWRAWRPCSGSFSTYPSVTISVIENISHSTAKMCRSTTMHVPRSCSDCQWYISVLVACKPMWASRTVTNNPSPHNNAELLLVSTTYFSAITRQIKSD